MQKENNLFLSLQNLEGLTDNLLVLVDSSEDRLDNLEVLSEARYHLSCLSREIFTLIREVETPGSSSDWNHRIYSILWKQIQLGEVPIFSSKEAQKVVKNDHIPATGSISPGEV